MTISTSSSQVTLSTGGSIGPFSFPFVGVSSSDVTVSSISSSGSITQLLSSQYTLTLNAANPNSLWGVGGSVTLSSTPSYPSLLIERTLPLTQQTSVQNQGNYYAQVTEQALDILCMEVQQVSARTTQFRGTWTTNTIYNVGDIVQDGANGSDTLNYYICLIANTSGTWSTDLGSGDWGLSVRAVVPSTNIPITLSGAISGSGTTSIATGIPAGTITGTELSSTIALPSGATAITQSLGDNTTALATDAFVLANAGKLLNVQSFTSSGTYTPTAGTTRVVIYAIGGGGSGGCSGQSGTTGSNGTSGGTTSVGTLINVSGGAFGGFGGSSNNIGTAGAGGTVTTATIKLPGSSGANGAPTPSAADVFGATGGSGIWGSGAGAGGSSNTGPGSAGGTNTGAGGGGAAGTGGTCCSGGGGGAGGQGITYATGITGTYTVTIGAGGSVGIAGTGGALGGAGGTGLVIIFEYQ